MPTQKMKMKLVGKVTESERDEIKYLFERKNGLIELFKCIEGSSSPLYDKIVMDMGESSSKFQKWWDDTSSKYHWEGKGDSHWEINFDTCEIFLHQ